jgi:hypothetical protein
MPSLKGNVIKTSAAPKSRMYKMRIVLSVCFGAYFIFTSVKNKGLTIFVSPVLYKFMRFPCLRFAYQHSSHKLSKRGEQDCTRHTWSI